MFRALLTLVTSIVRSAIASLADRRLSGRALAISVVVLDEFPEHSEDAILRSVEKAFVTVGCRNDAAGKEAQLRSQERREMAGVRIY